METSVKKLQQRKFYTILPALALPFITFIFWALGGGKVQQTHAQVPVQSGLLMHLPAAALKDDHQLTKLDFYNQARADSLKFRELIRNDPNYKRENEDMIPVSKKQFTGLNASLNSEFSNCDSNEEKVYRKLAELEKQLTAPAYEPLSYRDSAPSYLPPAASNPEIDRLEEMMKAMSNTEAEQKELEQLSGMLESILDIQHPQRVQQRFNENRQEKQSSRLVAATAQDVISLLEAGEPQPEQTDIDYVSEPDTINDFFSWSDRPLQSQDQNTIRAVIHETQTVVNGSTVKLCLTQDAVLDGVRLPKDNFIFGTAQLSGERLKIRIDNIRYQDSIYPTDLTVHDLDGMEGIFIPGAISREAVKQSADRSINTLGIGSLDPSLGAQAASAAVEVTKNLLSKKVKLIKITLKAGYQVLLQNPGLNI